METDPESIYQHLRESFVLDIPYFDRLIAAPFKTAINDVFSDKLTLDYKTVKKLSSRYFIKEQLSPSDQKHWDEISFVFSTLAVYYITRHPTWEVDAVMTGQEMCDKYGFTVVVDEKELIFLNRYRNIVKAALSVIKAAGNKGRIHFIASHLERSKRKYPTGSCQSEATSRRIQIYVVEGGEPTKRRPDRVHFTGNRDMKRKVDSDDDSFTTSSALSEASTTSKHMKSSSLDVWSMTQRSTTSLSPVLTAAWPTAMAQTNSDVLLFSSDSSLFFLAEVATSASALLTAAPPVHAAADASLAGGMQDCRITPGSTHSQVPIGAAGLSSASPRFTDVATLSDANLSTKGMNKIPTFSDPVYDIDIHSNEVRDVFATNPPIAVSDNATENLFTPSLRKETCSIV